MDILELNPLTAVGAIDGRYRDKIAKLAAFFSEFALIKARLEVSVEYFLFLTEDLKLRGSEKAPWGKASNLHADFTLADAAVIKKIETQDWDGIPRTNHDVVAVLEWLRRRLASLGFPPKLIEWVHFGLTSEDVNNLAYGLLLRRGIREVLIPSLEKLIEKIEGQATRYAGLPMLARTHGQPASPTTLGKELRVFSQRMSGQLGNLDDFRLTVKLNGASGNHSAHLAAFPEVDWVAFANRFVDSFNTSPATGEGLEFEPNSWTTQIEPHDTYAELFGIFMRINVILVDFAQDLWRYISDDWLVQTPVAGEVGSSAMPHKVNPIDFENAEGNLLMANALMELFCRKLPISRLQRDLSDSTVERNFGAAFAHCLVAYEALAKGLGKVSANEQKIAQALADHPEVVAEGIQTILRRSGLAGSYNLLKDMTRGKSATAQELARFIDSLDIPAKLKQELHALTPATYIGLASKIAVM